jgi:hypothetical protein
MRFRRRKTEEIIEAEHALEDAKQNLNKIKRRDPAVKRVAAGLRQVGKRNHFGEALEEIIMRRGQAH